VASGFVLPRTAPVAVARLFRPAAARAAAPHRTTFILSEIRRSVAFQSGLSYIECGPQ